MHKHILVKIQNTLKTITLIYDIKLNPVPLNIRKNTLNTVTLN
jgi:hypothetical protein